MTQRTCKIAVRSLRMLWRYPLRSGLLVLSAATGVIGVVCSVNYAAGGTKQLLDQVHRMGTNVLIVSPAQSRVIAGRARTGQPVITLVKRDYRAVRREILRRTQSSATVSGSFRLKAGDLSKNAVVVGCEAEYFVIRDWRVEAGEAFNANQERTSSRVVLLGYSVAGDLFGGRSPLGERLLINRVPFTVIGVLKERGQGLDVSNEDSQVYVPLTTAMRRLMNINHYSEILIEIDSVSAMDSSANRVRAILHQLHHIQPNQPDDFQVENQKMLIDTQRAAARRLTFFLRLIGASALLVSALGMLGITWIAIKERTREFGTVRALGATTSDVFVQVFLESTALALLGCITGLMISVPLSQVMAQTSGLPWVFVRTAAAVAIGVAALLDIGFAAWPARSAAVLDPIRALRYE